MDPLPLSPQILRRRLLCTIVTGIATKPSRSPYQIPTAWDAIDLAILVRIVITRIIQTSIVVDNGMDVKPIENLRPEARQERRTDGTAIPRVASGVSAAPSLYRRDDTDDGAGRRRDND